MSKDDKPVLMWVNPDFKKKCRIESANNDMNIIEFTKYLSNVGSLLPSSKKVEVEEKKRRFRLEF